MSTFVLVHGAQHGAWCWYKLAPRLESAGHIVKTVDLPAHGIDTTPVTEVSLKAYVQRVGETLEETDGSAVLVGHSSTGGVVVTQSAEWYTDVIDSLVYLSAVLLPDGASFLDLAGTGEASVAAKNMRIDEEAGVATIAEEAIIDAFYGDCSDEDIALARSLLRPEPLAPLGTPVETSDGGFGSLPRVYIECARDRTVTPVTQQRMREELPCDEVYALDSSHSPFFSAPSELAEHLNELA